MLQIDVKEVTICSFSPIWATVTEHRYKVRGTFNSFLNIQTLVMSITDTLSKYRVRDTVRKQLQRVTACNQGIVSVISISVVLIITLVCVISLQALTYMVPRLIKG